VCKNVHSIRRAPERGVPVLVFVGIAAFGWPLFIDGGSGLAHSTAAPWLLAALMPLVVVVVVGNCHYLSLALDLALRPVSLFRWHAAPDRPHSVLIA
jgi:hypothetical protein